MDCNLRVDIVGSRMTNESERSGVVDFDFRVQNLHPHPVHITGVDFLVEQSGIRDDGSLESSMTTRVQHSCIIAPKSSSIVKVPVDLVQSCSTSKTRSKKGQVAPYALQASLNIKDTVHGAYQVSTGRIRGMFSREENTNTNANRMAKSSRAAKLMPMSHLDGEIDGLHFVTYPEKESAVGFELQVKNSNFLPLKLLHISYSITSAKDGKVILDNQMVDKKATIKSKSTEKIKVVLRIPTPRIAQNANEDAKKVVLPVIINMEFWFKEPFYGLYKIEAKKSGELIFPRDPIVKLQRITFAHDSHKRPVAQLELKVSNENTFDMHIRSMVYHVYARETGSNLVKAVFKTEDKSLVVQAHGHEMVHATAMASSHSFGSALWDLFKNEPHDLEQQYLLKRRIEADTAYGKVIFE